MNTQTDIQQIATLNLDIGRLPRRRGFRGGARTTMTRRSLILAALVALALPASAAAHPFLSKAQAEHDTRAVALRSAHHIWRMTDTTVDFIGCDRAKNWIVVCSITVGLHFTEGECVPPVEEEAVYAIGKISGTEYLWRRSQSWEHLPVSYSDIEDCELKKAIERQEPETPMTEAEALKKLAEVEAERKAEG